MRIILMVLGIAMWLASSAAIPTTFAQTNAVAVVVNEKNSVHNLSTVEVRRLFSGERRSWPGGVPVMIFVRAPGAYERIVLLKLFDMSESEYKRYWTAKVFRGEAPAEPVALFSNGMQKEAITAFAGAIALVNFQDVKSGMKVVRVDGFLPGEEGYPLH